MSGLGGLDWNMVGALAALTAAIGAVIAVWWQNRQARFNTGLQVFWELERQFYRDSLMKEERVACALAMLRGHIDLRKRAEPIGNFFEFVGLLLRRGAIDKEFSWSSFYLPASSYWHCEPRIFQQMQQRDPSLWTDFRFLVEQLEEIDKRRSPTDAAPRTPEHWRKWLSSEADMMELPFFVQEPTPETSPEPEGAAQP